MKHFLSVGAKRLNPFSLQAIVACVFCVGWLVAFHSQAQSADPLKATGFLIAGDANRTRVVIDFNQKPEFSVRYLQDPNRTIVDIPSDVSFEFPAENAAAAGLYTLVRYGAMSAGHTRIVLTSDAPSSLEFSKVEADSSGSFRLVLEGVKTTEEKLSALVHADDWDGVHTTQAGRGGRLGGPATQESTNAFVIAVDAGHGGIDTGAISRDGKTIEKDITLAFAQELADEFNARPGFKAFLTRSDDVFLSLSERVRIARQNGANLMISLHADTLRQSFIRGATVYTISEKASDRLAAELAQRENVSDEIAGVVPDDTAAEASDILIDLTRRETQAFSERLAKMIVATFEGQIRLINNPHRHAGFHVLRAPDVPSLLIELGFLSNKEDEKLLTEESYRKQVSGLIVDATDHYKALIGQ
ncbi:N-acetylmuramoyl-L-alanine amidase [Rhizobium sp. L1K21]|uniref:N-acetylmuramoyl-L-alanine amidase n=1 Tax=Rhizobium sp. L1K21 TaxID=2954933 RepID=UPI003593C7D5